MHTKHRHRIRGSHPLFLLTEETFCQAPFPSASQLPSRSPALDNAVTHLPAHTGKPSFLCIDPKTSFFSCCHCLLSPLQISLYSSTCFLDYFLFRIIIPLFLDPLTMAFCPLVFCSLVPFSFHPFTLFPYFCIPAPGTFIFIPFLKAALFKCLFFVQDS